MGEADLGVAGGGGKQEDAAEGGQDREPGLPAGIDPEEDHDQGDEYRIQVHQRRRQPGRDEVVGKEKREAAACKKESQQDQEADFAPSRPEGFFPQQHPDGQDGGRDSIAEEEHDQDGDAALHQGLSEQRVGPVRNAGDDARDKADEPFFADIQLPFHNPCPDLGAQRYDFSVINSHKWGFRARGKLRNFAVVKRKTVKL